MSSEAEIERMVIRILGDASRYERELQNASNATKGFERNVNAHVERVGQAFEKVAQAANNGARQVRYLSLAYSGAIFAAAGWGSKLSADAEKAQVSFSVLLRSQEKAAELMGKLVRFAATTPFELPEVTQATRQLLAFGVANEDILRTLRMVGDISAGIDQPIAEIAELYGKAKVQGRLFMEDINQLTGRGIPIIQELAKQFNVAESEIRNLVEKGKIHFKNLEKAFISLTTGQGIFSGMMEVLSQTMEGKMSTLKDDIANALKDLGKILAPIIGKAMDMASAFLSYWNTVNPAIKKTIATILMVSAVLAPILATVLVFVTGFAVLIPSIIAGIGMVLSVLAGMAPFIPIIVAIGAALTATFITTAIIIARHWKDIITTLKIQFSMFQVYVRDLMQDLGITKVFEGIKKSLMSGEITLAFKILTQEIKNTWHGAIAEMSLSLFGMVDQYGTLLKVLAPSTMIPLDMLQKKLSKSALESGLAAGAGESKLQALLKEAEKLKPTVTKVQQEADKATPPTTNVEKFVPAASQAIQAASVGSSEAMERITAYRSTGPAERNTEERMASGIETVVSLLTEIKNKNSVVLSPSRMRA